MKEAGNAAENSAATTLAAVAAPLTIALLLFGGAIWWSLVAIALAVTTSGVLLRRRLYALPARGPMRWASLALWGMALWSLIQLVPLPLGFLRVIAPRVAADWADAFTAIEPARWAAPLSLDPPATAFMALTTAVAAATFDVTSSMARPRGGRSMVASAVLIALTCFLVVALAHPLAGLDRPYGIYAPLEIRVFYLPILPTLLNPNHAAAAAAIAPPLFIAVALDRERGAVRGLAAVLAIVAAAVTLLTLSRSGAAVVIAEMLVMTGYVLTRGSRSTRARAAALAVGIGGAAALLAGIVALPALLRQAGDADASKVRLLSIAVRVARDHLPFGVGRGATGPALAPYENLLSGNLAATDVPMRFTHIESWPGQLFADTGVIALPYLIALVVAVVACARAARRNSLAFAALTALVGLAVHDLVDFAMELAAVAMLASALLAIVTASGTERQRLTPAPARELAPRLAILGAAMFGVLTLGRHQVEEDGHLAARRSGTGAFVSSPEQIAASALRHPREPFFPMLLGIQQMREDPARAARYLLRAVQLSPTRAQSRFWLGRWFLVNGRGPQAYAELREAVRLAPALSVEVAREMVAANAPIAELSATSFTIAGFDRAAALLSAKGRGDELPTLDDAARALHPCHAGAWSRVFHRARVVSDAGAESVAAEYAARCPNDPLAALTHARAASKPDVAEERLNVALARWPEDAELRIERARLRGIRVGWDAIRSELDEVRALLGRQGLPPYRAQLLEAQIADGRGESARAIQRYVDAANASGELLAGLDRAAELAESSRQLKLALQLYNRLAAARPSDQRYSAAIVRIQSQFPATPGLP